MGKYLRLKFKDAKIFPTRSGTGKNGKVYELGKSPVNRKGLIWEEYITPYQISNVLHVMFGERPVSSVKKSFYPRIDKYVEMANNSYLKMEYPKRYNKTKKMNTPITEILRTEKPDWNSWAKGTKISWEIIRVFMNEEELNFFLTETKKLVNKDPKSMSFKDLIEALREVNTDELCKALKSMKLSPIANYIGDDVFADQITRKMTHGKHTAIMNINGIAEIININGEILVPVNDDDLKLLETLPGSANILDGGMVWISEVVDANKISSNGFKLVKKISTIKVKYETKDKAKKNK